MPKPDDVLISLRRIIRATDRNSKRLSRSSGLTIPQSVLMRAISEHPGATLRFLTDVVSLSQGTVSTIVDRLEERGLVVRKRKVDDKRAINLSLTEQGAELLRESPPPLQHEFRERFERLPDGQKKLIVSALDSIATMMDAGELDASPILTLGRMQDAASNFDAELCLRPPTPLDGARIHALVRVSPPLDQNSMYCNLLQCTHFAETSVVAERSDELLGFITGHRPPERPDTLFVWQVAVSATARGEGLGKRMLAELFSRPALRDVRYLETTITPDNEPSTRLFASFANERSAASERETLFERDAHFRGQHDTEVLLRIGPFAASRASHEPAKRAPRAVARRT